MSRRLAFAISLCICVFAFQMKADAGTPHPPGPIRPLGDAWATEQPTVVVDHTVSGNDIIWFAGQFGSETAAIFAKALDDNNIAPGATVMFHSPGGDPMQAMKIGRMIRARSLRTSVGRRPASGANLDKAAEQGLCVSACSVAFIGGVIRTVPKDSYYVIHTIAPMVKEEGKTKRPDPFPDLVPAKKFEKGLAVGERQFAVPLIAYLREMGIDLGWYVEASKWDTENGEAYWVSPDELTKWHVVAAVPDTKWLLLPRQGQVYLVAKSPGSLPDNERRNELSFVCTPERKIQINVYYTPFGPNLIGKIQGYRIAMAGRHRSNPPAAGSNAEPSLVTIDPATIVQPFQPVTKTSDAQIVGALILTDKIVSDIGEADDVNFRFYTGENQYQGFDVDLASKRDLFRQFIETCS